MKCLRDPDATICNRCKRKSLTCFYETHRRGRKPGTKLRPKAERLKASGKALPASPPPTTTTTTNPVSKREPADSPGLPSDASPARRPPRLGSALSTPQSPPAAQLPPTMASDSLAPFALLRKSATAGNFTIANILNVDDQSPLADDASRPDPAPPADASIKDPNDPVNRNLINMPVAQGLFDNFFKYMNPFICQFDPAIHTIHYIRTRSSFLFAALLAAAAKVFSPQLYFNLHDHVEFLLRDILGSGQKSTEIVQGICLVTHWKEPSDSRAWMLVGYAIRACMEMGWHKLSPTNMAPPGRREDELELRERRNKERTWLMLFVYDRSFRRPSSVSLQLGRPSMIHMDFLIRNVATWHQHDYAIPGIDEVMVAFVQLRVLGFDLLDLFWLHPVATTPQALDKDEFILKTFNTELDSWQAKWYRILDTADYSASHQFLIRFYGHHLRLLIHSFRLQLSTLNGNVSNQALWICYSNALEMFRLVVQRLGATNHLYYCQDSVHVMVAYAAVVTIKVSSSQSAPHCRPSLLTSTPQILLSMPGMLSADCETAILDVMQQASDYFGNQCSANNTSCFYQSRFLANVVAQYRKSKAKPKPDIPTKQHNGQLPAGVRSLALGNPGPFQPPRRHHHHPHHPASAHPPARGSSSCTPDDVYSSSTTSPGLPMPFSPSSDTLPQQPHPASADQLRSTLASATSYMHPSLNTSSPSPFVVAGHSSTPTAKSELLQPLGPIGSVFSSGDGGVGNPCAFASFTDSGAWENLFAHAGFNINSGAFITPNLEEQQ
ncbi:hypothetical protein LOZ00_003308 [Ophidiomyces ophidiicola]|nr:hypothetical protein LOZ00_003308 [Ophidiomyces ophidiicola]